MRVWNAALAITAGLLALWYAAATDVNRCGPNVDWVPVLS